MNIPRVRITLSKLQIKTILKATTEGNLAIGGDLDKLSTDLMQKYKRKYCILTANGFTALLMSIYAMKWKKKRIGIPAAGTCFSVVNAIRASGNIPVYVDNELESGNMNIESAIKAFKKNKIDAIINPNHNGNISKSVKLIENGIPLIEDNAQSAMSLFNSQTSVETFILSFYTTKDINGIDGGAILTNDSNVYEYIRERVGYRNQKKDDDIVRYNYSMQNINAALALESLNQLECKKNKLLSIRKKYDLAIEGIKKMKALRLSGDTNGIASKYIVLFDKSIDAINFEKHMKNSGINASKEFILLPKSQNRKKNFKNGQILADNTRSIPYFESMREPEINYIVKTLIEYAS